VRRAVVGIVLLAGLMWSGIASAQQFSYKPAGQLESGTQGRPTTKVWVPNMRFPVLKAPAYANSQVWGHGGYKGPGGGQCDQANYSYPWYDNYCEPRQWEMPLCPGGTGHQGQDIRPKTCSDATHWVVAAEAGTIIDDSGTAIKLKTSSGRTHRYLHLAPSTVVVDVGDQLQPGDKIGKISNYTGGEYPTTIHLHYDVRQYVSSDPKSGESVSQVAYLPPYPSLVESYKQLIDQSAGPYAADMEVRVLNGEDRYTRGTSEDVPDYFPGDSVRAAVYLKNAGTEPWPTSSYIGYWFESPYLRATSYRIDTDYPERDQSSWMRNSADSASANPPSDQLGEKGQLLMHAFSSGETKRVLLEMEAERYSIGAVDHPDVRTWVRRIEGLYGTQSGFFETPSDRNAFGSRIRDYAQLDVLSRDHWHFEGPNDDSFEGWSSGTHDTRIHMNNEDGLLTQKVTHDDPQLISPDWTRIDADRWNQLVLRLRSHDGPSDVAVFWAGEGESFSADRHVSFRAAGDGATNTYVVPIAAHSDWTGKVHRLRVDLLQGEAPAEDDRKWHGIADLFFQSTSAEKTNSARAGFVDRTAVALNGPTGTDVEGGSADDKADAISDGSESSEDDSPTTTVSGCRTSPGGRPSPLWMMALLVVGAQVRQQKVG
jgi:hypothetical protein